MKRRLLRFGLTGLALAIGGFLLAASGIIPIKASSGHWPVTEWFLHFSMRRSIALHSLGIETPELDVPQLVLKGAGHYEVGCRPCHGSPGLPLPLIPRGMTPHPPDLRSRIAEMKPRELFYVVKHGVKFTGMPAWPAQRREDEIWAIVAFLRELPTLNAEGYRRLAHGEVLATGDGAPIGELAGPQSIPRAVLDNCARCHGTRGEGRGDGAFPRLAGQSGEYLENAMHAYADGTRYSGIMQPIAAALTPESRREIANYYASQAPLPRSGAHVENQAAVARGALIVEHGIPSQRVPSCTDCHGPGGSRRKAAYPLLAGQQADYLKLQLQLFQKGYRGGSAYAHLMHPIAARLTPEQIRDVALYLASVRPDSAAAR